MPLRRLISAARRVFRVGQSKREAPTLQPKPRASAKLSA